MPRRSNHEPCSCASNGRVATQSVATITTSDPKEESVRARNGGSWEVRAENRAEVLASARSADGAPLTHPDAMPVALAAKRQPREAPVGRADNLGRKIC